MNFTNRSRTNAAQQESMTAIWRDWCSYLHTQHALHELRNRTSGVAFERTESLEEQEAQLRSRLEQIPANRRISFDRVRDERVRHVQAELESAARSSAHPRLLDPDSVDHQVLQELLDEAEGRSDTKGWGFVPVADGDHWDWYKLDITTLLDAPNAALYSLGRSGPGNPKQRMRLVLVLCGIAGIATLMMVFWPGKPDLTHAEVAAVAVVNSTRTPPWPVKTLLLHDQSDRLIATIPVSATSATTWPTQAPDASSGFWQQRSLWPLTLCIPARLLNQVARIEVDSGGMYPLRSYRVQPVLPDHAAADLLLMPCTQSREQPGLIGIFQNTTGVPTLMIGSSGTLDTTQLTVTALDLIGPGEDPLLPAGQAQVRVEVHTSSSVDWAILAPTLLTASGAMVLPSDQTSTGSTTILRYLVPLPTDALDLRWSVTAPSTASSLHWRTTLPPPRTRDAVLRDALHIHTVKVTQSNAEELVVQIRLANLSDEPLLLLPSDLVVTRQHEVLPITPLAALQTPIAPDAIREIAFTLPARSGNLILTVGPEQFQITLT